MVCGVWLRLYRDVKEGRGIGNSRYRYRYGWDGYLSVGVSLNSEDGLDILKLCSARMRLQNCPGWCNVLT